MRDLVSGALASRRRLLLFALLLGIAAAVAAFVLQRASAPAYAGTAVTPQPGRYVGQTGNGEPVRFRVKNGRVRHPVFSVQKGGCGAKVEIFGSDDISDGGWFVVEGGGATEIRGRFVSARRVKGRVTIDTGPFACGVISSRYRAHHK
jgi:hypothetical protein